MYLLLFYVLYRCRTVIILMTLTWAGVSLSSLLVPDTMTSDNMASSVIKGAGLVQTISMKKPTQENINDNVKLIINN